MIQTMKAAMQDIVGSISRKKASFGVAPNPDLSTTKKTPFTLMAGSHRMVEVNGGFVVTMGLRREQIVKLRDSCNELLERS